MDKIAIDVFGFGIQAEGLIPILLAGCLVALLLRRPRF